MSLLDLKILSPFYVLMTIKSKVLYKCLFKDLVDFPEENGFPVNPQPIMTDLALVAIKASKSEIQVLPKSLFFPFSPMHLAENSDE